MNTKDRIYDSIVDEMKNTVNEKIGKQSTVIFSAWRADRGLPVNNLNDMAIEGEAIIVGKHDPFWGEGEDYQSSILKDPTWLDLCEVAEAMIHTTGDTHHIFLESVKETNEYMYGVPVYKFFMGS